MNALLISINAKFIHTNNAVRLLKANSDFPCTIKEFTIKDDIRDIMTIIERSNASLVGISVYIWNVEMVKKILNDLNTSIPIVLGGPEVSYDPEYFLSFNHVSYIIKGEGEIAFNQLLHALNSQGSFEHISNISYLSDTGSVHQPIEEIMSLDTLNPPYYFEEDIHHIPNRIAYIESSRGCPYQCSYCLSSLEKKVRFFNIESVKKAIDYYMSHGVKTIKFLDRTFNANKKTLDLIQYIIDRDNHQTVFQFEITGDILDPKLINFIHKHSRKGLFRFEIGIQSLNEKTNALVNRYQNNQRLFDNIKRMVKEDIITLHLDLIAGLPEEDKASFINTFNTVFNLGAKELQCGFLKLLRGTALRTQASIYGIEYHQTAPYELIKTGVLSEEDIREIHDVEHMLELYHNKGYFKENMHQILLNKDSVYHFLLEIASHYNDHNYSLHRYQLDDIYKRIMPLLTPYEQFLILQDYLMRSTIKPKAFWKNTLDKSQRKSVLEACSVKTDIPLHLLFKHTRVIHYENMYFVVYYKGNHPESYVIKKDL
ncbi:MAG: DUF4080 domain-containing protein [Candidatus Izemoplasma sp.]|nr:DUF4080 domain-containing protein [Candidatus Izemoplasma sp.]